MQSKDYSPRDPAQEFHNSPDLASRSLQQKVYLVKVASKMRVQLQQYHRYGEHYGLSKSDIDNYVLHYSFDGLGSKYTESLTSTVGSLLYKQPGGRGGGVLTIFHCVEKEAVELKFPCSGILF